MECLQRVEYGIETIYALADLSELLQKEVSKLRLSSQSRIQAVQTLFANSQSFEFGYE